MPSSRRRDTQLNTVKSYIRTIYRKIGVGSRTQAVLWGVKHGFTPDHHRHRTLATWSLSAIT